jgi:hypothetical protein
VTGKALFIAPRGRTFDEFLKESKVHGWPSFRDQVFEKRQQPNSNAERHCTAEHTQKNRTKKNITRYFSPLFF